MYRQIKLASSRARKTTDALAVFLIAPPSKSRGKAGSNRAAASGSGGLKKKGTTKGASGMKLPAGYAELDKQTGGVIAQALGRPEFSADKAVVTPVYPAQGFERVYLVGLGEADRFDGNALREAAARLVRTLHSAGVESVQLALRNGVDDLLTPSVKGHALADGLGAGAMGFTDFKGAMGSAESGPDTLTVHLGSKLPAALGDAFADGLAVSEGVKVARTLSATPPNVANPAYLVRYCRAMAKRLGLGCRVIDAKQAKKLGMGGLLAVGAGGSTEPAIIALEYGGQGAEGPRGQGAESSPSPTRGGGPGGGKDQARADSPPGLPPQAGGGENSAHPAPGPLDPSAPLLLVGKAITFDTGGYSLKSTSGMKGMKYDKCGGMAVIGAMEAIGRLKPQRPVVGLIPTAENMIDTHAYRVDDIITLSNGVTVEVTNTDAEGRLVLADALAWGTKEYQPRAVIDLATLTGGVVVALGAHCAGLWCNDEGLRQRVDHAAEASGEACWELPLWDAHREQMHSDHADLCNSSGTRGAHPIQGAAFLSHFVGETAPKKMPTIPWAHLDIAGVASTDSDTAMANKGPTGWGVRLLAEMAVQE